MIEKRNTASFYATAVTNGQKKRLLRAYGEYISLVRTLESIISKHTIPELASRQIKHLFPNIKQITPWSLDDAKTEDKQAFDDFINLKYTADRKYCFVCMNVTTPNNIEQRILSTPSDYQTRIRCNTLPHVVERYVAAFPKEAILKDTSFIINGKYILNYENLSPDMTVAEALDTNSIEEGFQCIFEMLGQISGKLQNVSDKELRTIQNDALASAMTAPVENTILSSLALLTEEANHTLKDMLPPKKGENYLSQAENGNIIPSAARFQDYQSIRHLLHHQWDSLDNIGRFTFYNTDRNISVRERYLDGYRRLCNQSLVARCKAYAEVAADFTPLIQGLLPEFMIREPNESPTKFIARLKAYKQEHPTAEMFIDTSYSETNNKKAPLIKNIEKLFPEAKIIDRLDADVSNLKDKMKQYIMRKNFLEVFADIEYKICQYCLFLGCNQPANKCWQDITRMHIIAPEDVEKWNEYKKLRNTLSHHIMDNEVIERLEASLVPFADAVIKIEETLAVRQPDIYLVEGNVYRAIHPTGKTVEIDFKDKRVLKVTDPYKKNRRRFYNNEPSKNDKSYTEEHPNGLSITLNGTDIAALRMQNGTIIDLVTEKIVYPNYATFYFNSAEHNTLICKGIVKILTDKNFHILNYINKGKSVEVSKNDVILLPNSSKLSIDAEKNLETETYQDHTGNKQKIMYNGKETIPFIRFDDGTTVRFKPTGAVISHAGIELSYQTRKAFAESYTTLPPAALAKDKNITR